MKFHIEYYTACKIAFIKTISMVLGNHEILIKCYLLLCHL